MKLKLSDLYDYLSQWVFSLKNGKKSENKIGLELEMLPFDTKTTVRRDGVARCHFEKTKNHLNSFLIKQGWETNENLRKPEQNIYIYKKNEAQISFEPGGQLEYSSKPFTNFDQLESNIIETQNLLQNRLSQKSILLLQTGVDPWNNENDIGLQLTNERYRLMKQYFGNQQASMGHNMMLQTSALQICLDFNENEETQVKRYITSQLLSPYGAAIFANSPYFNGNKTEYHSYRTHIWLNTDKTRTGFPPNLPSLIKTMNRQNCIESYLNFVLDAHLIFYHENGKNKLTPEAFTFRKWMESSTVQGPNLDDFKKALTLLFPEVRPKGFLEIRSVDAQDYKWQMVPTVFYAGILYDEKSLNEAFELLKKEAEKLPQHMQEACYGLDSPKLYKNALTLMNLSLKGFKNLNSKLGGQKQLQLADKFNETYVKHGRTPSHDYENYLKKAT